MKQQQPQSMSGRPDWGHVSSPVSFASPPWQLHGCTFLMIGAEFDRALAQSLVPEGLEVVDEATGGFYMYTAARGWGGVAPFSATLGWIDVKGFDSSDGSHGRYQWLTHYSDPFFTAIRGWNRLEHRGYAQLTTAGDRVDGVGGPEGEVHLRMSIEPEKADPRTVGGTHFYLMISADGRLQQVPVAYYYDYRTARPSQFDNLAPSGTLLQRLVPRRLHWAGYLTDGVITVGAPMPIGPEPPAGVRNAHVVHLNLLSQLGRGALVVGPGGRLLFSNEAAHRLADHSMVFEDGLWRAIEPTANAALNDAVHSLVHGRSGSDPVVLRRGEKRRPLLVQPLLLEPARPDHPGSGSVLFLLTDPDLAVEHDPQQALQLLGLSRAEAKIATLVGSGHPPKEAARRLGNTEGTVRFSLNQIYRKLGVARQSELARVIARIETLGV